MLHGCDISEVNGTLPPSWFKQWQFIGIRVFNEWGRLDNHFSYNWATAKSQGIPRLAYGWPRHGLNNTSLGQQLVVAAPGAECGYWADYEHSDAGLATPSELEDYLRGCDGGFYSNLSELPRTSYLDQRPWWFANPSNNPAPRSFLIEQYGIVNGIDVDTAFDTLLMNGESLTGDEHAWLQFCYIQLGGAKWEAAGKPFPIPDYHPGSAAVPLNVELHGTATP